MLTDIRLVTVCANNDRSKVYYYHFLLHLDDNHEVKIQALFLH